MAMNQQHAVEHFKEQIAVEGSQKAWGTKHGFSVGFICDVLAGRKPMSDKLLASIGLTKAFEPID